MKGFFGFGKQGKLLINRNNKLVVRQVDFIQQLAAMNVGAWGDPHMYIRQGQSLNPNNYTAGKFLAKWGDNKVGSNDKELLLLSVETVLMKVQIYYTNQNFFTAKTIKNIRVVYNNVSTTYTNSAYIVAGPITISIIKLGVGANAYLNFEMKWNTIYNIVSLGGALTVVLRKIADSGGYWNGGDGATHDGFGVAAQAYGLTRASFETANITTLSIDSTDNNFNMQTNLDCDLQALDVTAATALSDTNLADISYLKPAESTIVDDLHDTNTNQTVDQWDPTVLGDAANGVVGSLAIFEDHGTLDHYLANMVNAGNSVVGLDSSQANQIIADFESENTSLYASSFSVNMDYIP